MGKPKLSVVISFFNEEEVLPVLIQRLRDVLGKECNGGILSGYELIFVNDASTDGSEDLLLSLARLCPEIKIITMSRNFGISPCVLAGMEYSTGDLVIYMDADLQDPPEVIPQMLKAWREGDNIDIVNTVRLTRKGESSLRLLLTRIGYKILRRLTNINFLIEGGDFKLLSRRAVLQLLRLKEKQPFLRGLIYWMGFNQAVVYYHRQARHAGKAKFPLADPRVIHNFLFSQLISFSDLPLQFALFMGAITTFLGFCFLIHILYQRFVLLHAISGWAPIIAVILFLGGIQLLTMGIIGLYINAIFLETKKRPNYIISRSHGFKDN